MKLIVLLLLAGPGTLARFVDPFIGSANGGNTFPGAVRPWGMVSVSPHTDISAPSGYINGRTWFYGLGQVHLSGTGCPGLGSIIVAATSGLVSGDPEAYRCHLNDQSASPGYWAGTLAEPALRAEATTTLRSGLIRFTPLRAHGEEPVTHTILIDAGRSLSMVGGGSVAWVSDHEVQGFNIGGGFCGEDNRHRVYFFASLSGNISRHGTWLDTAVSGNSLAEAEGVTLGAWATYEGDLPIEIRIGISYVSEANARANLETEAAARPFEDIRRSAGAVWETEISRIVVSGGTDRVMTVFYTALYHALIHPSIISDVNGEYPLFCRPGAGRNTARPRYSVFSLWDTYRTLHPLLSLVYPERQSAIVSTMIDMYRESGWLPKWELAGTETHMMAGDGAVNVIADTYVSGIRDFDTLLAYQAMRKPGLALGPEAEPSRPGYRDYLELGYIPQDQDTSRAWWVWGPVSNTLEYCYSDWTFSRVALGMGREDDAREFARRSRFYRNLFDSSTGFLRPRNRDGGWLSPFDPLATEGSGNWKGSGGPGYVEGNAWQYAWFVPHDIGGIAQLFGGTGRCAAKLDCCFADSQFTINNEPDIAYPYLFTYLTGYEQRTREIVRTIMSRDFATGPGGLPGNDDAGTISSWFIFSALGFYPACPASGEYRIGVPLFPHAAIHLNRKYYRGSEIRIETGGSTGAEGAWHAAWNGEPLRGFSIDQSRMTQGGELLFPRE